WAWGMIAPQLFPGLAKKPAETGTVESPESPDEQSGAPVTTTASEASAERPAGVAESDTVVMPDGRVDQGERSAAIEPVLASAEETVTVQNEHVRAVFGNRGAELRSLRLKEYREIGTEEPVELVRKRSPEEPFPFAIRSGDESFDEFAGNALYVVNRSRDDGSTVLGFTARDETGREVRKRFIFSDEEAFRFEVETEGLDEPYRVVIGPGVGKVGAELDDRFEMSGNVVFETDDDYEMLKRRKVDEFMTVGNPTFIGLADHYFLSVLLPDTGGDGTVRPVELARIENEGDPLRELWVGVNDDAGVVSGLAYFGPKKAEVLEKYGLGETLELGIFGIIARFLLEALIWVNSFTHNFGWAIVVLTVIIKLALYPLQHKSIVSMKRMQKIQPKMNAIRDKYRKAKTDPEQKQKMNLEMMELYKKEGINPMGGCLPILLQLPILWAFYILLSHAIELRGEPWILWITDLSAKDPYYITPILMTITMFIQQWITPTAADPMQRKIFLAMPIIFGWIFKEFPSGLVLYWLVQNLLTILQQGLMNRWWKQHPEALERGAAT
ncbi:MAG: membrane protein insertase YidC, partial [Thermoanaerobaculia bacterium]|nr:membrane protein insertase YidC [Thermoanaerobaculia bacterium]